MVLCANYSISKSSGIFFFKLYGLPSISELRFDENQLGFCSGNFTKNCTNIKYSISYEMSPFRLRYLKERSNNCGIFSTLFSLPSSDSSCIQNRVKLKDAMPWPWITKVSIPKRSTYYNYSTKALFIFSFSWLNYSEKS